MLAATARQRGITLDYGGLPASFPAHVDGDKVVQMMLNTVGNALKYTEEGGFVRVWLQSRSAELPPLAASVAERFFLPLRTFTLVVEDNGMGMSEEVLRTLFAPFRRGPEAEANHVPGTGLGLHITRGLVEAHGGSIELNSSPDMGTTVWIVLPRDPGSEHVLRRTRQLTDRLQSTGSEARLAYLDARRPDREPGPRQLREAGQAVREFADRLLAALAGTVPASAGERSPAAEGAAGDGETVVALADGLWAAVLPDWSRLAAAWEVERARPGFPALLQELDWIVEEPSRGAEAADAEECAVPATASRRRD
jgi:hypothetical protein